MFTRQKAQKNIPIYGKFGGYDADIPNNEYDNYMLNKIVRNAEEIIKLQDLIKVWKEIYDVEHEIYNSTSPIQFSEEVILGHKNNSKCFFKFDYSEDEFDSDDYDTGYHDGYDSDFDYTLHISDTEETEEQLKERLEKEKIEKEQQRKTSIQNDLQYIVLKDISQYQFNTFQGDYNRFPTGFDKREGEDLIKNEAKYVPEEYRLGYSRYNNADVDLIQFFKSNGVDIVKKQEIDWIDKEQLLNEYIKIAQNRLEEKKKDLENEKKVKEQKPCRCGSTTHKRTNHHECPLNKKNIKSE